MCAVHLRRITRAWYSQTPFFGFVQLRNRPRIRLRCDGTYPITSACQPFVPNVLAAVSCRSSNRARITRSIYPRSTLILSVHHQPQLVCPVKAAVPSRERATTQLCHVDRRRSHRRIRLLCQSWPTRNGGRLRDLLILRCARTRSNTSSCCVLTLSSRCAARIHNRCLHVGRPEARRTPSRISR
jgi:hypothetical protein